MTSTLKIKKYKCGEIIRPIKFRHICLGHYLIYPLFQPYAKPKAKFVDSLREGLIDGFGDVIVEGLDDGMLERLLEPFVNGLLGRLIEFEGLFVDTDVRCVGTDIYFVKRGHV